MDWARGATLPNYVQAAANTQLVGKQLALLMRSMSVAYGVTPTQLAANVHFIGFSLGAHIAGFAGNELNSSISRITGLDPAAPLFEGYSQRVRLDSSDAQFVDVIHTNGDGFLRGGLGSYQSMGHVDFYPNGGRSQAGCNSVFIGALSDLITYSKTWSQSLCHHRRSFKYFVDSINACTFRGFKCPTTTGKSSHNAVNFNGYDEFLKGNCFNETAVMGYHLDQQHQSKVTGKFYLVTRDKEPYCCKYRLDPHSQDLANRTCL